MFNKIKEAVTHKDETKSIRRAYIVMLIGAVLALIAAFVLSVEKVHLLSDPNAVLSCSFNVVLNCSAVMQTPQSAVFFGIPNMFIGMVAFPVIVTVAVAALWGGAKFNKGFLKAANIGILLGTIFAYWLFFTSVYVIQVLCPWCLIVTFSCTLMIAAITHINLRQNTWGLPKDLNEKIQKFLKAGYHQLIVASWLVIMVALVFLQFGEALFA